MKQKIFDMFFSVKDSGFGIGMSVVKSIAKALNAEVEFTTAENKGTTFDIWIPVVK